MAGRETPKHLLQEECVMKKREDREEKVKLRGLSTVEKGGTADWKVVRNRQI